MSAYQLHVTANIGGSGNWMHRETLVYPI